jgi:hypothetical protein
MPNARSARDAGTHVLQLPLSGEVRPIVGAAPQDAAEASSVDRPGLLLDRDRESNHLGDAIHHAKR